MARVIYGARKDTEVDERFPQWAFNSAYAEGIYELWERDIAFRAECDLAQREPMFRGRIIQRIEEGNK